MVQPAWTHSVKHVYPVLQLQPCAPSCSARCTWHAQTGRVHIHCSQGIPEWALSRYECVQKIFSVALNRRFLKGHLIFSEFLTVVPKVDPIASGSPYVGLNLPHSLPSGGASVNNNLVSVSIRISMSNHSGSKSNGLKAPAGGLQSTVFDISDWN